MFDKYSGADTDSYTYCTLPSVLVIDNQTSMTMTHSTFRTFVHMCQDITNGTLRRENQN